MNGEKKDNPKEQKPASESGEDLDPVDKRIKDLGERKGSRPGDAVKWVVPDEPLILPPQRLPRVKWKDDEADKSSD